MNEFCNTLFWIIICLITTGCVHNNYVLSQNLTSSKDIGCYNHSETVNLTCITRGSQVLVWTCNVTTLIEDRLEIIAADKIGTLYPSQRNPDVVAELVNVIYPGQNITKIESRLLIPLGSIGATSPVAITCKNSGFETINTTVFQVSDNCTYEIDEITTNSECAYPGNSNAQCHSDSLMFSTRTSCIIWMMGFITLLGHL